MNQIAAYFDNAATNYQHASEAFPWHWLRSQEKAAVLDLLPPVAGKHALELGSGTGYYTRTLLDAGAAHVTAVDISPSMLAQLPHERVKTVVCDAVSYQPETTHDLFCAFGILEFLPKPEALLESVSRYAKLGSTFTVLYPRRNIWGQFYRFYHRTHGLHISLFKDSFFERMAAQHGWRVQARKRVFPFTTVIQLERVA